MLGLRPFACVLLSTLIMCVAPSAVTAHVPQGFVGTVVDGPLLDSHVNLNQQLDTMVMSGVENLRVVFNWSSAEPYKSWADVPKNQTRNFTNIGNTPISFAAIDRIVGPAAARRLQILPVVFQTPRWAAGATSSEPGAYSLPLSNDTYTRFLSALIRRYGPHGSFWQEHPKIYPMPIRMWQIWNEPNLIRYWATQPFATSYVALLRAAHDTIKRLDPKAKVVLAGLTNYEWDYLSEIYSVAGSRRLFDVVASHPYTKEPEGVLTILQRLRDVMNRNHDAQKQIVVTEVSFPSSLHQSSVQFGFETTPAGQAERIARLLPMLGRKRTQLGLMGFYHYTWVGVEHGGPFNFAGLLGERRGRIYAKPAYAAFRRAALGLEGCKVKGPVATGCLRR